MKKGIFILTLLILALFSVSCIYAADVNDTLTASEDNLEIDQPTDDVIGMGEDTNLASFEENEILTEGEQTFANLNTTINGNTDKDIYLNGNYKYSSGDDSFKDGIIIDRDVNIYGNGHTINGSGEARIFKITGGNVVFYNITFVNGKVAGYNYGGAINGDCKAINCTFKENQAFCGGAMAGGSAVDCTFIGNHAKSLGGAMYGGSAVDCIFSGNSAWDGGAMSLVSAVNCTFTQNTADYGGAMDGGSAVNCTFIGNTAKEGSGGAMDGGSAVNCTFTQNNADYGGAMFGGSAVNCTFTQNNAGDGGAMFDCRYLICSGQENEYVDCDELDLYFDVSDFTSTYNSNEEFLITLNGQNGPIDFINTDVVVYKDGVEVSRYSCLSGDSVIFDLAAGKYTANLTITYPNLEPKTANIKLTINKATPKIEVQAYDTTYPNVVVNVKSDVGGVYVVRVGDKSQSVTLNAGVGQDITFTGLAASEEYYTVNVTNLDLENCTAVIYDTVKVIVHKATPRIEVQAYDTIYPGDAVVNVKSDVAGVYAVNVGGVSQNVTLIANEGKNVTFTGLTTNEEGYIVNVTNLDLENCTAVINDMTVIKIRKGTVKITSEEIITTYNADKIMTVTLTDSNGNPISGANITVDLNGTKNYTTDSNGQVKISTQGLISKVYTVNIAFEGNENYNRSHATTTVTINKDGTLLDADAITTTYNINKNLVVTLKDSKGFPLSNQLLFVDLNGVKMFMTDSNGQVKISTQGLSADTYIARIIFPGDDNYRKSNAEATVTINKDSTSLSADAITTTYNINKNLVVTLKDSAGKSIKGVKVTVVLNGKTYTTTTDANGQVKVSTKALAPKAYTATITFAGNTNYVKSTGSAKVTVTKATPKLTAKAKTFKKSVKTKKYAVTLKDNTGKVMKKVKLTLKIKGKTYKATTNTKGKATFKITKFTKKGTFKAVVTYKGNAYYNKVTKTVKIKIK